MNTLILLINNYIIDFFLIWFSLTTMQDWLWHLHVDGSRHYLLYIICVILCALKISALNYNYYVLFLECPLHHTGCSIWLFYCKMIHAIKVSSKLQQQNIYYDIVWVFCVCALNFSEGHATFATVVVYHPYGKFWPWKVRPQRFWYLID